MRRVLTGCHRVCTVPAQCLRQFMVTHACPAVVLGIVGQSIRATDTNRCCWSNEGVPTSGFLLLLGLRAMRQQMPSSPGACVSTSHFSLLGCCMTCAAVMPGPTTTPLQLPRFATHRHHGKTSPDACLPWLMSPHLVRSNKGRAWSLPILSATEAHCAVDSRMVGGAAPAPAPLALSCPRIRWAARGAGRMRWPARGAVLVAELAAPNCLSPRRQRLAAIP